MQYHVDITVYRLWRMVIARTLALTHCSRLKLRNPSPIAIYPTVATDSEQTMSDVGMDQWKLLGWDSEQTMSDVGMDQWKLLGWDSEQTMPDVGMDQWKLARMWVFIIVHHGVYISRIILQCPVDFERF